MPDYSKTQMYKLHCNITGKDYYGHTTMTLTDRLYRHKSNTHGCTSQQIIDGGDYEIIHLEYYPCANRKEATARERWWVENNTCVNYAIPGRTQKEYFKVHKEKLYGYQKKWRDANKTTINASQKRYYDTNKEAISARDKVHRETNREAYLAKRRAYNEANKEAISARMKSYHEWNKSWDGLNRIQI